MTLPWGVTHFSNAVITGPVLWFGYEDKGIEYGMTRYAKM